LSAFSNYKRINSNKYNKQNWIWKKKRENVIGTGAKGAAILRQRGSLFGTGWCFQPVPMEA
jgi:hypothetical protein